MSSNLILNLCSWLALVCLIVAIMIGVWIIFRALFRKPALRHPDSKDLQVGYGEVLYVKMESKTAAVGYNPTEVDFRWLKSWQPPHEQEAMTQADIESIKQKVKAVIQSENRQIKFIE